MKKVKVIVAIFVCVSMIALAMLVTIKKHDSHSSDVRVSAYKELSVDYELQKKFTALKILKLRENGLSIDLMGKPLVVGKWYIRINATRILLPVSCKNSGDTYNVCNVGIDELNLLSSPFSLENAKKEKRENVLINNGTPSGIYVDAEVLLTGKNELFVSGDLSQQLILNDNKSFY